MTGKHDDKMPEASPIVDGAHGGFREPLAGRLMPWVLSVLLHAGLVLVMVFVTLLAWQKAEVGAQPPPDIKVNPPSLGSPREAPEPAEATEDTLARRLPERASVESPEAIQDRVFDPAAPSISPASARGLGLGPAGSSLAGQRGLFDVPIPVPPDHTVYVIDRSGSMVETFPDVKAEIRRAVRVLKWPQTDGDDCPRQDFDVILFAEGPAMEYGPGALVPATDEAKAALVRFLDQAVAHGKTDPLPALSRAFDVLRGARGGKGKLICLLTDGEFQDNDAVVKLIRQKNRNREVTIYTYLYGRRPQAAEDVLKQIARENGGQYTYVKGTE